jgi:hypothetical protein
MVNYFSTDILGHMSSLNESKTNAQRWNVHTHSKRYSPIFGYANRLTSILDDVAPALTVGTFGEVRFFHALLPYGTYY